MSTITSIRRNKNNRNRCSVFVDDEFFCSCDLDVVTTMSLHKGQQLSEDVFKKLKALDRRIVLRQKVWRFVSYKPRTEAQVESKLRGLDCSDEELQEVTTWLREFGFLDDTTYTQNFIDAAKARKPMSPNDLERRLVAKGIDKNLARTTINNTLSPDDVVEAAFKVAEKKVNTMTSLDRSKQRERLQRFLNSRGYGWDVIKATLRRLDLLAFAMVLSFTVFPTPGWSQVHQEIQSVQLTITIIDAITDRRIPVASVVDRPLSSRGVEALSSNDVVTVYDGLYQRVIGEHERLDVTVSADGYFSHNQKISVRDLDSNVTLRLTARLYPVHSTIATVTFQRGSDTLGPVWSMMLERIGREIANQSFKIEIHGWDDLRYTTNRLVTGRIANLKQNLISLGVAASRITTAVDTITTTIPYPLYLRENVRSQQVSITPHSP